MVFEVVLVRWRRDVRGRPEPVKSFETLRFRL